MKNLSLFDGDAHGARPVVTGFAPRGQKVEVLGQRGEIVIRRAPIGPLEAPFVGKGAEAWRALST